VTTTREVTKKELQVGMILLTKTGEKFRITKIMPGIWDGPYLTYENIETGKEGEGDTCFHPYGTTYTVVEEDKK
jgi:hypothetical protein